MNGKCTEISTLCSTQDQEDSSWKVIVICISVTLNVLFLFVIIIIGCQLHCGKCSHESSASGVGIDNQDNARHSSILKEYNNDSVAGNSPEKEKLLKPEMEGDKIHNVSENREASNAAISTHVWKKHNDLNTKDEMDEVFQILEKFHIQNPPSFNRNVFGLSMNQQRKIEGENRGRGDMAEIEAGFRIWCQVNKGKLNVADLAMSLHNFGRTDIAHELEKTFNIPSTKGPKEKTFDGFKEGVVL